MDSFLRGSCVKRERHGKSIAGPLTEDTHASRNLKNCVRTPARRIPAANLGMFPRRQLAPPFPPPSPTRTPTSAAAFTGAASKPLASRRDRRSSFWCLRGTSWRAAGDPLEVCRRSHRGPGHLRKINEMSLEAHLEILRACLVSVVWTWGSRLREVLVSATVTIYLFSLSTHWRTAADAKEAEEPTTNAQSKGNYVFVTRVGSMTYIFCVFYIRLPPGSSGRGGGGGRGTGRGMVPRWLLAARTKFLLCWNNETLTQHV